MRRSLFLLLALALLTPLGHAQTQPSIPMELPLRLAGTSYDGRIPTPADVLGFAAGARHARPEAIVDYYETVAELSDRVTLDTYAFTVERRPLIQAIVTSPANHARLEAILEANRQLSDAPGSVSDAEIDGMPSVVWMGYSVHGNEASGADAALLTLHHLAAGQSAEVTEMLDDLVIILDPVYNPDGRARFVGWIERYQGALPIADDQDIEHSEAWPGGRTNHYWFDLNRDWLPAVHPSSQGRLERVHRFRPQFLTDFHEMGGEATYFFQPGIPSRTNPNTPQANQDMAGRIAEFHAAILDDIGSLYYSKESFDDFYYGKGSTYPDVNGTVGILFEQGSSRALQVQTENNGLLTYAETVRNQFATSISSLRAAVRLRTDLLKMQRDFYAQAPEFARQTGLEGFVFGDAGDAQRAAHLARLLGDHRIQVEQLAQPLEAEGKRFEAGSFYVPIDQAQARLINGVMERPTTFTDSLFYDVSAWTLPLAYGLPMASVPRGTRVQTRQAQTAAPVGSFEDASNAYAYLIPWGRLYAPRALYALQEAGLRVRLVTQPTTLRTPSGERTFERGTLVVPVGEQDIPAAEIRAAVRSVTQDDGVDAFAAVSGLALGGPDLGSGSFPVLRQPTVALVVGSGTSSANAGEIWHHLGERMEMPVVLLDAESLGRADLSRYTTLIMAGGFYDSDVAGSVGSWVRQGGHLIAATSAVDWAVRNELAELEAVEAADRDSILQATPYAQLGDMRGAQAVGGLILNARVDLTHPVAFGLTETFPFFRRGTTFFEPSEVPGANVAVYLDEPLAAGYISPDRLEQASGAATVVALRSGRGSIVLLHDNPAFRGFWIGTSTVLMNAIFFGGAF
jgi:hypothetical protein